MTKYETLNVKLSNSELNKLDSGKKMVLMMRIIFRINFY